MINENLPSNAYIPLSKSNL